MRYISLKQYDEAKNDISLLSYVQNPPWKQGLKASRETARQQSHKLPFFFPPAHTYVCLYF